MSATFKCIRIDDIFYPVDEYVPEDYQKRKTFEVFINGTGWKKCSTKKIMEIPRYSLQCEDWETYLKVYGIRALFYSLTNVSYGSADACHYNAHMEFNAVLGLKDVSKYVQWLHKVFHIQELCKPYLEEYQKKVSFPWKFIEEHTIIPHYTLWTGRMGIPFGPTLDPISDERMLDSLYWKLGLAARNEEENIFITADEIIEKMKDDKEWPVSVRDKMIKMFNKDIADLYEECLTFFIEDKSSKIA